MRLNRKFVKNEVEISAYPEPPMRIEAHAGSITVRQLRSINGDRSTWAVADWIVIPADKVEAFIERLKESLRIANAMYEGRNQ